MVCKNLDKKIMRKVKRAQNIISEDYPEIQFSETPTNFITICNAGLTTGLLQEQVLDEINSIGKVSIENVVMLPGKSYCFLQFLSPEDAATIHKHMNGISKLGQNDGVLYLSYSQGIPKVENSWNVVPPAGLVILKDFISDDEEKLLLSSIDWDQTEESNSSLKHRQVKHYGYEFIYGSNNVTPDQPLPRKIPVECDFLWQRLAERNSTFTHFRPDQMTINVYQPGHGIPPHCDTHSPFEDPIVSLSLGGDTVMDFSDPSQQKCSVDLPGRTLLVMSGESRYGWTHGIVPRHMDIVQILNNGGLTVRKRTKRVSFTFRKLRKDSTPCSCKFPTLCDSQIEDQPAAQGEAEIGELASKLEEENVHKVYNEIGSHFSETRHTPWPKVQEFIESLPAGGVLLDVGCGNGKYLNINDNLIKIGCDRSEKLLGICNERNFNSFQCDCLFLPLKDQSVDGCISIAVVHHLATKERRLKALSEMARILTPTGRALIYVWAKNQEANRKKSSYLRQNKQNNRPPADQETDPTPTDIQMQCLNLEKGDVALPVHTNRTQFQHQDMLVPWKLKNMTASSMGAEEKSQTFLRFYHVFEENELEALCSKIPSVKVVKSYYDQGNWCVIFEKIG